ncbi:unnamed protein product [Discosporangium mesarthrocarpum]
MPKGRKRAIKAAMDNREDLDEREGEGEEADFMMELKAAREMMEEQSAKKAAEEAEGTGRRDATQALAAKEAAKAAYNKAGLLQKAEEISLNLPWEETLTVCEFPLELEDVHDDLKREVSFYTNSLEAVKRGKELLLKTGIPYKRPTDFLCEMVKTDSHMDKIKDKLIFEQQKMEAFNQRKNRQEQRKYAKELSANKQAEKAKRKRDTLDQIESWKEKSKRQRGGPLADDDGLESVLCGKGSKGGRNFKREAKDKKYGFGGKKSIKGKSDPRALNDLSDFNPKRGGSGSIRQGKSSKSVKRPGKSVRTKRKQQRRGT